MQSDLSWVRRSQRVIRMVSELHRIGYQRLRIMPYVYPLAYRVAVAPASAFSIHNGAYISPSYTFASATYSSAQETNYFDWADAKDDNARQLAEKFVVRFPRIAEEGRGRDWTYAGWLAELVGHLEHGDWLPFVSEEYFSTKPYSLVELPIWDWSKAEDEGIKQRHDFPMPPPGPVDDDPRELTGEWDAGGFLAGGLELASRPNYLGSPDVVQALVRPLFEQVVKEVKGESSFSASTDVCNKIASAVSDDAAGYARMPAWHTPEALGFAEIEAFDLDPEYYAGESLYCITTEAMAGVSIMIKRMLKAFMDDPLAQWERDALPQLNVMQQFVVSVLMGTNAAFFPDQKLSSFEWKKASA